MQRQRTAPSRLDVPLPVLAWGWRVWSLVIAAPHGKNACPMLTKISLGERGGRAFHQARLAGFRELAVNPNNRRVPYAWGQLPKAAVL